MELHVKSSAISNSEAITYGGLVAVAIGINKKKLDLKKDRDYFPDWDAYNDLCSDPDYSLLIDRNFMQDYRVYYNIMVKEKDETSEFLTYFGFIAQETKSGNYVIAIRGTQNSIEFDTDKLTDPVRFNEYRNNEQVPEGLYSIFENSLVVPLSKHLNLQHGIPLTEFAAKAGSKLNISGQEQITVLGHSLGSAVATYFAAVATADPRKDLNLFLCTFASPMPGDKQFAETLRKNLKTPLRIYNTEDPVPKHPTAGESHGKVYSHITGDELPVSSKGDPHISIDPKKLCAHQLSVYLYLLGGKQNPNIIGAGGHKDCQLGS